MNEFKIVNKRIRFCYNHAFFGYVAGDGYIQVFPLERWNEDVDKEGNVYEEFINGDCANYNRGDMLIRITHSKTQVITISNTVYGRGFMYYITTTKLPVITMKGHKKKSISKSVDEVAEAKTESPNYVIVRITEPLSMDLLFRELKIDSQLLNKLNPDYELFLKKPYPTDYYKLRLPADKLDSFISKKEYLTTKSKKIFKGLEK